MEYNQEYNALKVGELIAKEIQGNLSAQEAETLRAWKNQSQENADAYNSLYRQKERLLSQIDEFDTPAALERVLQRHKAIKRTKRDKTWWYAAASIFLVSLIGTFAYLSYQSQRPSNQISQYGDDVMPAKNLAYITLSDGSRHELKADKNEVNISDKGITYADGSLITATDNITTATIEVPKGGIYNITLPDGTKVYLNSATTLHYPIRFAGAERKIKLEGEGYFEVAHNPDQPFIVTTGIQDLKVLGTHFNIQAYPGEKIASTLIEGSVELIADTKTTKLSPGYQAVLNNEKFVVNTVNTADYTAWMKQRLIFNDTPLSQIFKSLERSYDVSITYPLSMADERYYMELKKDKKLSELLDALSQSTHLKFKIEGRRVMASQ